ncbi:hypothetical protein FPV67DRAFT_1444327 [Lyophyllum atratum]|nr:hypothetical protein FPV67DRAFT_1444327 [Lyophyllum atratum]
MRASVAFFVLTVSGRPFLNPVLFAQAHPVTPKYNLAETSTGARPAWQKRNTPPPDGATAAAFLTPAIILSLVFFVLVSGTIIAILFYRPQIQSFIRRKLKRQPDQQLDPEYELRSEPAPKSEPSFGFGFDGLTNAQMEMVREKEEKRTARPELFIRLPAEPPSLVLRHHSRSPLLPIDTDLDRRRPLETLIEAKRPPMSPASSSSSTMGAGDPYGSSSPSAVYKTEATSVEPKSPLHSVGSNPRDPATPPGSSANTNDAQHSDKLEHHPTESIGE